MTDRYPIPDFLRRQPAQPAGPRERPILFSAPMIRAILAGTKTQTRRVVKPQPVGNHRGAFKFSQFCDDEGIESYWQNYPLWGPVRCPYGKPSDKIWVRENGWERPERTPKMMREGADTWAPYYFDADGYGSADAEQFKEWGFKRRPSIHMPRWASRILLEVVAVRVERLQDISEADAMAEGTPCYVCGGALDGRSDADCHCFHRKAAPSDYRNLWESINGAGSWDANPWVWIVEFRRI